LNEIEATEDIAAGRFSFLHYPVDFGAEIDWHNPAVSQLWRYHLHYFSYVRSLAVATIGARQDLAYATFRRLALSWIQGNKRLRGDGWHPYTLSLRLGNWAQAAAVWNSRIAGDSEFAAIFYRSMYAQARILRRQVEFDVRGNHLIENLRALLWMGAVFRGAEPAEWTEFALCVLRRETEEQIASDGGHFERSPGYHCVVLKNYVEIALLLERNGNTHGAFVTASIRQQAYFLREILGPSRRLPLIKDTAYDATPDPSELLTTVALLLNEKTLKPTGQPGLEVYMVIGGAGWRRGSEWQAIAGSAGVAPLSASGFYVLKGCDGEYVVIDAGKPCPEYLPAHAHADTFNFELCIRGIPIVVDSGVYEYHAGPWRDFFRSTRAHNTVEINGQNSSEVWASFRVGRGARPRVRICRHAAGRMQLFVEHDGYRYLPGKPILQRVFLWRESEYLIVLDRVLGTGAPLISSYLHFHPDVTLGETGVGQWRLNAHGIQCRLHQIGDGAASMAMSSGPLWPQGWYSERFGYKVANSVMRFQSKAVLPHLCGYAFSLRGNFEFVLKKIKNEAQLSVTCSGGESRYRIAEQTVECIL